MVNDMYATIVQNAQIDTEIVADINARTIPADQPIALSRDCIVAGAVAGFEGKYDHMLLGVALNDAGGRWFYALQIDHAERFRRRGLK